MGGGEYVETSVTHHNDWENNDEHEQVKPKDPNRVLLLHNPRWQSDTKASSLRPIWIAILLPVLPRLLVS